LGFNLFWHNNIIFLLQFFVIIIAKQSKGFLL